MAFTLILLERGAIQLPAARAKMLVVDDVEINRAILYELFCEQFDVLEAENGKDALDIIRDNENDIAIILLDLVMPVMDGFAVLRELNRTEIIRTIPVIMITGESGDENTLTGYGLSVSDIINKPFNSEIVKRRVNNVVDLYSYKLHLEMKLDEQRQMLEEQERRLSQSKQFVIDALSTTVEFRNGESGDHIKRVRLLTKTLLEHVIDYYPMSPSEIEIISGAAAMHDIGKIAIPDSILLKPGPLTKEEFEIMKTHTVRGCEILETLDYTQDPAYYKYCYEICRHHHERWDGRGYPDGLKGDEISIWAQATALADVYDALTSKRVYKAAYGHEKAVDMIVNGECGTFNPVLIKCMLEVKDLLSAKIRQDQLDQMHVC